MGAIPSINRPQKELKAGFHAFKGLRQGDDKTHIARMLLELLQIIVKYDDADDRDYLIFGVGEAIYPTTFEGRAVIDADINRCVSRKVARKRARAR